jgi:hypothetical protein
MTRRTVGFFVTLTLLVVPLTVEAQPSAPVRRIGLLCLLPAAIGKSKAESFSQGLRDAGYIEGKHILIESWWAEGHGGRGLPNSRPTCSA